jgi:hypothetical protein
MSNSHTKKNISSILYVVPSNRGYIIDGQKIYGKGPPINSADDVRLLDNNRNVNIWLKRGFLQKKLEPNNTEWDAFSNRVDKCRLITSRDMRPCPAELSNAGLCQERSNPNHRKFYYHFTKYNGKDIVYSSDDHVMCRYDLNGKSHCWEKNNILHMKIFSHLNNTSDSW